MSFNLHHVHIFASNIEESIKFYQKYFNGKVVFDQELAGARNVFIKIGKGRLHLYDQPPKNPVRGNIHHFGIQDDNIEETVKKMKSGGIEFKKEITDLGVWKYIMVPAPDDILIELFEIDKTEMPKEFLLYFE